MCRDMIGMMLDDFPSWLRYEIMVHDMDSAELAAALGIGKSTVESWLYSGRYPSGNTLLKLLDTLDYKVAEK